MVPSTLDVPTEPADKQALLERLIDDLSFWDMSDSGCSSNSSQDATGSAEVLSAEEMTTTTTTTTTQWKTATDPVTGRIYYYHSVSLKTQWEKPTEVRAIEKQQKAEQKKLSKIWFQEMEQRLKESIQRGELIPGIPRADTHKEGPPLDPMIGKPATIRMRTISGMDENVMRQLREESEQMIALQALEISPKRNSQSIQNSSNESPPQREGRPPLPNRRSGTQETGILFEESVTEDTFESDSLRGVDLLEDSPAMVSIRGLKQQLPTDSDSMDTTSTTQKPTTPLAHVRRHTETAFNAHTTMDNPDIDASIKCVCGVYRQHIVEADKNSPPRKNLAPHLANLNLAIFNDGVDAQPTLPKHSTIETFYQEFFKRSQMELDTIIMSLIYVERLIKETNGVVSPNRNNWRSILFACMILASKVWDDLSMWNADFSNVSAATGLSHFTLERINNLEIGILTSLGFSVKVSASEYAKYYFLIRNMLFRGGLLVDASAEPNDLKAEKRSTSPSSDSKRRANSFDLNAIRMGVVK